MTAKVSNKSAEVERLLKSARAEEERVKVKAAKPTWHDDAISAPDLCDKQFPDIRYVIPGLIPEGVTLLVSRPKLGKSWLLQQLSSSVAQGSITLVAEAASRGDVLHLTLEDGQRRFQRRMKKYFGSDRRQWPARMTIVHKWRRLDQGGIADIREWCGSVPNPTLVTIDTITKVRPAPKASDTNYATDYATGEQLIALCHEFPGLAIVIAHHDRKAEAEDVFDTVSGTLGLTGGVDTIIVLKRNRQGVTLHIQGRDLIDPIEKAVHFDRETGRWMILGEASEVYRSKDERLVMEALRGEADGLSVKDIMAATGIKSRNNLDQLLGRMAMAGAIERRSRGVYVAVTPVH